MSMKTYRTIDLFAGVECVFTSEIDKWACRIYRKNFPADSHDPFCDVTKVDESGVPDFDVLLAGFPCQAFSIAGKRGGFEDTRGTLFFDVARIMKEKRPKAFLLENVKGLTNHRGGETLGVILNTLREDLGYTVHHKVLNAHDYGLAQCRERIYIVGFDEGFGGGFRYPEPVPECDRKVIRDIMEEKPVSARYYLSETYLRGLEAHRARHESKGNGFGYVVRSVDEPSGTIVCGGMGRDGNLIVDARQNDLTPVTNVVGRLNDRGIRRMTPLEWERLQGFPDGWTEGVSDTRRYRQMGNSVAVGVIEAVCLNILKELENPRPARKPARLF